MKCPQCGSEFNTPVEQCFTCGWEFNAEGGHFVPRTSKLAVFTLVVGILCLLTFYLPLLPVIIIGIIALRKIRKSRGRLTGERIAMAGILIPVLSFPILLTVGGVIWSKDAGPVPNEFTEADLVHVKQENQESWNISLKLCEQRHGSDEYSAIGLTQEDSKKLRSLEDEILKQLDSPDQSAVKISESKERILHLWGKTKMHEI